MAQVCGDQSGTYGIYKRILLWEFSWLGNGSLKKLFLTFIFYISNKILPYRKCGQIKSSARGTGRRRHTKMKCHCKAIFMVSYAYKDMD
ncbi:hypothetical protein H5410_037078 [Solanum commersonii]|uniref:Uncharacterized protein n=1 Tax=Solanum commersonii TaxID=4109 RepID=A0A9J5YA51_SOLCO|nr:hypothetical protein H5410_037078 [Solanum commersonii]